MINALLVTTDAAAEVPAAHREHGEFVLQHVHEKITYRVYTTKGELRHRDQPMVVFRVMYNKQEVYMAADSPPAVAAVNKAQMLLTEETPDHEYAPLTTAPSLPGCELVIRHLVGNNVYSVFTASGPLTNCDQPFVVWREVDGRLAAIPQDSTIAREAIAKARRLLKPNLGNTCFLDARSADCPE